MRTLPLFCILVFAAATAGATVPNGTFNTDTGGWFVDANFTEFTSLDWNAGTAEITSSSSEASKTSYVYSECFAVAPSSSGTLQGEMFRPSSQGTNGRGFLFIYWFKEPTCRSGASVLGAGPGPIGDGIIDSWQLAQTSLTVPSDAQGARVGLIVTKDSPGGSHRILFDNLEVAGISPAPAPSVVVTSSPQALVVESGTTSPAGTTSYTLTNLGDAVTNITLGRGGDQNGTFFQQAPSSFQLPPSGSQTVTLTAVSQSSPSSFRGFSSVAGSGVPAGLQVPVQMLVFNAAAASTTRAQAVTTRVDLAAPSTTTELDGTVTFRNDSATTGVLVADVPWIIPQSDAVSIPAGQTISASFRIDRSRQPGAETRTGSITGRVSLVYPIIDSQSGRIVLQGGSSGTSLAVPITDTRQPDTTVGLIPALAPGEVAMLIPGIGHVVGSGGKEFISDVSIVNVEPLRGVADLRLFYSTATTSISAAQPLSANEGVQLSDVVNTYFDQGVASQGTLHVRSANTSRLSVNANVFNKADPAGSYGTAIPVFRSDRVAAEGESIVLTGLRQDSTLHTNLYLQEMSGVASSARVDFFDTGGTMLSTRDANVGAFGFGVLGAIVPAGAVMARITNTSGGAVQAYATPVDDVSGDTWAVADWNRQYALSGAEAMLVPVAGVAPGANQSSFRTDLAMTNIGAGIGSALLRYDPGNVTQTVSLGSNETLVVENVVDSLFGASDISVGSIIITPQDGARFAVTSRTYTTTSGSPATFGTGVPTLPLTAALQTGESRIFDGLQDTSLATISLRSGNTYRTNLGLVETSGGPVTVRVSVFLIDGLSLAAGAANGSLVVDLGPRELRQLNGIVRQVLGPARDTDYGDLQNVRVKVEILSGTGRVVAFTTATDNGTNDTLLRIE